MNILNAIKLKPFIAKPLLNPLRSSLHTRSLSLHREKPINWNTTHTFVLQNPLLSLLENCKSLSQLKQIQAQMTISGLISDGFALSRLIAFTAISESKNIDYCSKILFNTQNPNAFSWNVAIRGCVESEMMGESVIFYKKMLRNGGSRPDNYTYPLLFKACASLGFKILGLEILGHVFKMGFDVDVYVHNALIHMLVSCGELGLARKVFDKGCVRDLVSWNSLINGYVRSGFSREAIRLFGEMELEGVKPDEVTMIGVVSSCAQLEDLTLGKEFHKYIEESGLNLSIPLANALMDMYVKCGKLEAAEAIFDNMTKKTIVSWTTMIVGYAKFGFLDLARKIFYDMPEKDIVQWNAMIGGYVQAKRGKEALALFHEMQASNVKTDEVTMVHCLSACSQLGALDEAGKVRKMMKERGVEKTPGCSSIEVNGIVYEFIVRDKSHPESEHIYDCLLQLTKQLESVGYDVPAYGDNLFLGFELENQWPAIVPCIK
ncbi:hypothetical protein Pint_31125 [Pistacia integerrima]|uniref:Uncharacterized protein n=1 Tax=Pistacia integerrima TaxID=434235 RepID=A0ACC0XRK1_9ROSI|nr:hypothetical protein Pint_31125 [Pistacia integerrima]